MKKKCNATILAAKARKIGGCFKCMMPRVEPQPDLNHLCFRHWIYKMISRYGLVKGVLRPEDKSKREKLVAYMKARHDVVENGRTPLNHKDTMIAAYSVRKRLRIRWAGVKGLGYMAHVIQTVEGHARKIWRMNNETLTSS